MYYVNALEYLGRPVKVRGREGPEAKRFVTLKKTETMPTREEVISLAKGNPRVKKVWVMEIQGNKWRKAMDTINL
jgi:hypothetical protein